MFHKKILIAALYFALVMLIQCGGLGKNPVTAISAPTWDGEIKFILEQHCVRCHGENPALGAPADFRLDILSLDTTSNPMKLGALEKINAINNRVVVKKDMPPGSFFLSEKDRKLIENWVSTESAKEDSVQKDTTTTDTSSICVVDSSGPRYTTNVATIINNSCVSCHTGFHKAGGPYDFSTYEKILIRKDKIELRVTIESMPQNGSQQKTDMDNTPGQRQILIDWFNNCFAE